jgi:molybdopterin converting factor small subunit
MNSQAIIKKVHKVVGEIEPIYRASLIVYNEKGKNYIVKNDKGIRGYSDQEFTLSDGDIVLLFRAKEQ